MIIIKIALCGYKGKTGRQVYEVLKENNFEIFPIDKEDNLLNVIEKADWLNVFFSWYLHWGQSAGFAPAQDQINYQI